MNVPDLGLFQGPPGTGKTTVIAELAWQWALRDQRTLIASQTNLAVDNVVEKLAKRFDPRICMVRIGSTQKISQACEPYQEHSCAASYRQNLGAWLCQNNAFLNRFSLRSKSLRILKSLQLRLNHAESSASQERLRIQAITDQWQQASERNTQAQVQNDYDEIFLQRLLKRAQENLDETAIASVKKLLGQEKQTESTETYRNQKKSAENNLTKWDRRAALVQARQALLLSQCGFKSISALESWLTENQAEFEKQLAMQQCRQAWIPRLINPNQEQIDSDQARLSADFISHCNVVAISCNQSSASLREMGLECFDAAVVDEVSRSTPPELLGPMLLSRRTVLVGDHRQLPPILKDYKAFDELPEFQERAEEFRSLATASYFRDAFEASDESLRQAVWTQYRMHPHIMDVINVFYENKLKAGCTSEQKQHGLEAFAPRTRRRIFSPQHHLVWLDSQECPEQQPEHSHSFVNELEAAMACETLIALDVAARAKGYSPKNKKQVAVISFYGRQVREIQNRFLEIQRQTQALDVEINSVDRFQGKEKPIVLVSLVRSRQSSFLRQFERINVAFSRAQELLIILGNRRNFCAVDVAIPSLTGEPMPRRKIYQEIFDLVAKNGSIGDDTLFFSGSQNG